MHSILQVYKVKVLTNHFCVTELLVKNHSASRGYWWKARHIGIGVVCSWYSWREHKGWNSLFHWSVYKMPLEISCWRFWEIGLPISHRITWEVIFCWKILLTSKLQGLWMLSQRDFRRRERDLMFCMFYYCCFLYFKAILILAMSSIRDAFNCYRPLFKWAFWPLMTIGMYRFIFNKCEYINHF